MIVFMGGCELVKLQIKANSGRGYVLRIMLRYLHILLHFYVFKRTEKTFFGYRKVKVNRMKIVFPHFN